MRKTFLTIFALLLLGSIFPANGQPGYVPSEEIKASQQKFREYKLGIFIHWGIYSMLGQGEWVMHNQDLNYQEYPKLAEGFYPINFNAKEWVSSIKDAGAKYICITTRHHDGFSMFDTECSDYNIVDSTPYGKDIIAEIARECKEQGIALHFYYSTLDWGRLDYPRGRTGLGTGRPAQTDENTYFDFMKGQLRELLTKYGDIGCIWFDGHWDHDQDTVDYYWRYDQIYPLIHELQPGCLIGNNHHLNPIEGENIQIFERDIPGENTAGWHEGEVSALPLETCQTMNRSWGYRIKDQDYKSINQIIKYLVSTAGRDANLLLNVGPQPDGRIPATALERLSALGDWMEANGETIYGTRSTIIPPQSWGVVTHKENKMWLHIFPEDLAKAKVGKTLYVPYHSDRKVKEVNTFGTKEKLSHKQYKEGIFITLPEIPSDCADFIIEINFR